jgi:Spy/CpxP family protein refolding chaperone
MKKSIATTVLLATFCLSGSAQDMKGGASTGSATAVKNGGKKENMPKKEISIDQRVKNQSAKAEKELGLNAEQKAKWEAAVRERITANKPIKEKLQGSTTPEERKKLQGDAKANMKKFDESVSLFLTPEQKAKYEAKKKEKKDNFEKRKTAKKAGTSAVEDLEELAED